MPHKTRESMDSQQLESTNLYLIEVDSGEYYFITEAKTMDIAFTNFLTSMKAMDKLCEIFDTDAPVISYPDKDGIFTIKSDENDTHRAWCCIKPLTFIKV